MMSPPVVATAAKTAMIRTRCGGMIAPFGRGDAHPRQPVEDDRNSITRPNARKSVVTKSK